MMKDKPVGSGPNNPWDPKPIHSAEHAVLTASLQEQRDHVVGILEGLSETELHRPILPSGWTCLGLVNHLTFDVERFWFRGVIAGEPAVTAELERRRTESWNVVLDASSHDVLRRYRHEAALATTIIGHTPTETAPVWWPDATFGSWRLNSLPEVLLHVTTETACHAGHLDAARELLDGRTWRVHD